MGKVRLRHYRDTGLHRVVNRPLRATVPPGAKMHPAMRDLLAKMAQARRRDFSFCQPLPTTAQTSASRRSLLRKPCRNAMPSGREKLAISFLRSGSRGTQRGNTMALGYNATRRRWPSSGRTASPTSVCIPFLPPSTALSRYRRSDSRRLPTER